jgi:hypothetical protein
MQEAAAAVAPGSLVLGRYRPLRPLGSGGSGSVWLARDEETGLDVALKIVPREGTLGPRAEREAAAVAQLRHRRCLRVYARARDGNHVYIVYEYVPGRTLREALRAGDLDDEAVLEAVVQILEGLAHAHRSGIVHRDVKPANVLLEDGPELSVRLLDFGLALMLEEETLTAVGDIPGTLAYISPERLRGETAGPPADVWSVGVLLWEALAGRHPFWGGGALAEVAKKIEDGPPSLGTARPDLPKALVALVDRALAVNAAKRPSAANLAAGLRRVGETVEARAPRRGLPELRPTLERVVPALAAALFAGWTATALPFYPSGWPFGLAAVAGLAGAFAPRAALALALAVPIFPLGNLALGLAIVYAVAAAAWLAVSWADPRRGLFLVLGPLLAPVGALGLLPLGAQAIANPWRRAAQTACAVLAAGAVAGVGAIANLGIDGASKPRPVASALWSALADDRALVVQALVLAAAAAVLPQVRLRGLWWVAGFGAGILALPLLAAPGLPALPFVVAVWVTCGLLAAEPRVRAAH